MITYIEKNVYFSYKVTKVYPILLDWSEVHCALELWILQKLFTTMITYACKNEFFNYTSVLLLWNKLLSSLKIFFSTLHFPVSAEMYNRKKIVGERWWTPHRSIWCCRINLQLLLFSELPLFRWPNTINHIKSRHRKSSN